MESADGGAGARRAARAGVAVAFAAAWALGGAPAGANTVVVGSLNGTPGTDGAPNRDGTDGGDAATAAASASGPDAFQGAVALAGRGGRGGEGGDEDVTAGGPIGPGAGGNGGRGGTAQAIATAVAEGASAGAQARGGDGGSAGDGGQDSNPQGLGGAGGRGGDGGSASASAQATGPSGALVMSLVEARGGAGGMGFRRNIGGRGGSAVANASGFGAEGVLQLRVGTEVPEIDFGAHGGEGGHAAGRDAVAGEGGGAVSASQGSAAGDARVAVVDRARGGDGGSIVGAADGSRGGRGGGASSSASGLGGGDVFVSATAEGGHGGVVVGSPGFRPGLNPPPPDVSTTGDGGIATLGGVYGESTGGGRVEVIGTAVGGSGFDPDLFDRMSDAHPGSPRFASGDGASVELVDAVDGRTAGELLLRQTAQGGSAGLLGNAAPGAARSSLTRATRGDSIELVSEAIAGVRSRGAGRQGFAIGEGPFIGSAGAGAEAIADATNETGDAGARGLTIAGGGGNGGGFAGDGGHASVTVSARSQGDGDAQAGAPAPIFPFSRPGPSTGFGAFGGFGGSVIAAGGLPSPAGDGGDAASDSLAEAEGGAAFAFDLAVGGAAGLFSSGLLSVVTADGGAGSSHAEAVSDRGDAAAHSYAFGGDAMGGLLTTTGLTTGGDATSWARAQGSTADAHALANTGRGARSGVARATARTSGFSGAATAEAIARDAVGNLFATRGDGVRAVASAPTDSANGVEAVAAWARPIEPPDLQLFPSRNTVVYATSKPLEEDVSALLSDRERVRQELLAAQDLVVDGYGLLAAGFASRAGDVFEARAEFDIPIAIPDPGPQLCPVPPGCEPQLAQEDLLLAVLSSSFDLGPGERVGRVLFQVLAEGELLVDEFFEDTSSARDFLDDRVFDFGQLLVGTDQSFTLDLDVVLEFESTSFFTPGGFAVDFLVGRAAVPEPGTLALFAAGLAALAAARRSERA